MINGSTQFSDGLELFKQSLRSFRKHPAFMAPIGIVWLVYAPLVLYSKYGIPWHQLSFKTGLLVVFLLIFSLTWVILSGCSVMLEMIRQLEFGQELSVARAFGRFLVKDWLRIVPLALVWAIIWFILTIIQAILSRRDKNRNDNDSQFTLENSAKTLANYQSFSWSRLTFEALQKGARMIVFLILPAIVWEELAFTDAVKKGLVALKAQIKGFVAGYALTYATAVLVFLPPYVVIKLGSSNHGTAPLIHYPPWVWVAVIYYVGLAWSFCMYLEQMYMASLYYLQMNWLKAAAIAQAHGESVPEMHQVPIPELLGLPEIAEGNNNEVVEMGKKLYAQGDFKGAYQKFMKVLMRDPHHAEAQQYLKMTTRRLSNKLMAS